jgi:hypothetical protein
MFEVVDTTYRKIHLLGSGIASLAAAASSSVTVAFEAKT